KLGNKRKVSAESPYFIAYVKNQLEQVLGASRLYKGGLSIHTTLDSRLQSTGQKALADGLLALEKRMEAQEIGQVAPQAALIALDIESGAILAMVGGRNFNESPFNRATAAKRQPGSAFKPIVFAYALEQGFAQNKLILDAPVTFKGYNDSVEWHPQNFSKTFLGEITLREALARSQNIPAVRLIEMLGPNSVARFAHRLGINTDLKPYLSLALGTSEVTLIDLTNAYASFPRRGKWIEPFGVLEVTDHRGRIIWHARPQKKLVLSRESAAIMTNMLEAVILEGTGKRARNLKGPVAGKTGTTNNYRDALFIGFSPAIATGVWVGLDLGGTLGNRETGAKAALPIWIQFMENASASGSPPYFDLPDNVVKVRMNPKTGMLASDGSKNAVDALFRKGTEPKK
ncbi:MAG: penicillin-binding transpeptidase domain-containing protein, partial [Desulfobacterales bacterium]